MTIVECPICDADGALEADETRLDCARCGVRLEIAPDEPDALPAAA